MTTIHSNPVPIDLSGAIVHRADQRPEHHAHSDQEKRAGSSAYENNTQQAGRSHSPDTVSNSSASKDPEAPESKALRDQVDISAEAKMLQKLSARDREVRAHEAAHAAVGGQYAGSPSYTYQRGPDGRSYAVGGEVPIDVSEVAGDPEATVDKMQQIRRAAMAPQSPSSADRQIASRASQVEAQARVEMTEEESEEGGDLTEPAALNDTEESKEAGLTGDVEAAPTSRHQTV